MRQRRAVAAGMLTAARQPLTPPWPLNPTALLPAHNWGHHQQIMHVPQQPCRPLAGACPSWQTWTLSTLCALCMAWTLRPRLW